MTGEERERLILSLETQVLIIARKIARTLPEHVQVDDLVSAGWLGAIWSVDHFDASHGVTLASYAGWRIHGAICDYLRGVDYLSRDHRRVAKRREVALNVVTDSTRLEAEKITAREYLEKTERFAVLVRVGIHPIIAGEEQGGLTSIADRRPDRDRRALEAQMDFDKIEARAFDQARIGGRDDVLKRRLRIVKRYAAGDTMKEIGKQEGVDESRISQICKEAITALRAAA